MNALGHLRNKIVVVSLWLFAVTASATVFTTDTYIAATDFSYDGEDISVTNCTLTVEGLHGFNSLQIENGGVLTHSAFTNGTQQIVFHVINEAQTLSVGNPATLDHPNVNTNTILVEDASGTIMYTNNVDYVILGSLPYTELLLTTNSAISEGANVLV